MGVTKKGEIEQRHHDGHGLNDRLIIECDARGEGGASHEYRVRLDGALVAHVMFQNGPRTAKSSTPGLLDEAFIAIAIDRFEGFSEGPYCCAETLEVRRLLSQALFIMKKRANDRAARDVLGTKNR